jgi:(p)ppGpp synthase/HD superfamily hydrolase
MFSQRYEAALALAARRHDGQRRKGGDLPYLTHLVHVARILEPYGEEAVIAGLLHDLLEDTCRSFDEIREVSKLIRDSFGANVLEAVEAVSEKKVTSEGEKIPWRARKESYVAHLREAPPLALKVSAADKIHNIATLVLEIDQNGPEIWKRFRASVEESIWFYEAVRDALAERLGARDPLVVELGAQLNLLLARSRS